MSLVENEAWLEAAKETFEESVELNNWDLARAVIGDVRDAGFHGSANVLETELIQAQNHEKAA